MFDIRLTWAIAEHWIRICSIFSGEMYSPCESLKMFFLRSMTFKVPFWQMQNVQKEMMSNWNEYWDLHNFSNRAIKYFLGSLRLLLSFGSRSQRIFHRCLNVRRRWSRWSRNLTTQSLDELTKSTFNMVDGTRCLVRYSGQIIRMQKHLPKFQ